MAKCKWCGKRFDPDDAEDIFVRSVSGLAYSNFKVALCGDCAVQAIEDKADGIYFETCEECGKTFDLFEEESEFNDHFPWYNGTELRDHWDPKILCAECAINTIDAAPSGYEDDDTSEDGDGLSVWDAADIWASHGKDEEYMFGYTEEELENAL